MFVRGQSEAAARLRDRLDSADEPVATTIVSVEEVMRGWLAAVRRESDPTAQITSYARLQRLFTQVAAWRVLPWDQRAAAQFAALRSQRIRVGTMDLKIASIVLANNATLLTANTRDFEKVPGLVMADYLGGR